MASVSVTVPQLLLRSAPADRDRVSASPAPLPRPSFSVYCGPPEDGLRRCLWQNDQVCEETPRRGGSDKSALSTGGFKAEGSPATPASSHRAAGRRSSQVTVDLAALSDGALPGGWSAGDRVTQGRSGVVRKQRHAPPRREAWSIFQQEDPRVRQESGEGHNFATRTVTQDWCDACSRQVRSSALKCRNCSYTCHLECKSLIQLDCNQRDKQSENPSPLRTSATLPQGENATKEEEKPTCLSDQEVRAKIEQYNSQVTENGMKLGDDGIYTGFIKVHLKLRRPVTVPGAGPGAEPEEPERRTSFYLPLDAVKQLHISSSTTVGEVIQGLLKKFMVLDNPRKFALYRQTHRDGQDLFQKLTISEQPLRLRLLAGPDPECLTFVLKENETGDVEWHAFSVPELQNFLTILEKEERERVKQVQKRYTTYRRRLEEALQKAQGKPG
ncbi:ras association domain-containing protein 5 isoform X1 [Arapaima gigas]